MPACLPAYPHLSRRAAAAVGREVVEPLVDGAVRTHALAVAARGVAEEAPRGARRARVAVRQRGARCGGLTGGRGRRRRCLRGHRVPTCHGAAFDHRVLEGDVRHCCYLEDESEMVAIFAWGTGLFALVVLKIGGKKMV